MKSGPVFGAAIDYRVRSSSLREEAPAGGTESGSPRMAVLVQRLVPARASGVMFTADPVTGALDEITIEAAPGLGETLAQGKVHPDLFAAAFGRRTSEGASARDRLGRPYRHWRSLQEPAMYLSFLSGQAALETLLGAERSSVLPRRGIEVEAPF